MIVAQVPLGGSPCRPLPARARASLWELALEVYPLHVGESCIVWAGRWLGACAHSSFHLVALRCGVRHLFVVQSLFGAWQAGMAGPRFHNYFARSRTSSTVLMLRSDQATAAGSAATAVCTT